MISGSVYAAGAARPTLTGGSTHQARLGQKWNFCTPAGSGVATIKMPNATSMVPDQNFVFVIPTGSTTVDLRFTNYDDTILTVYDRAGGAHTIINLENTVFWGDVQAVLTCSVVDNSSSGGFWLIGFLGEGD